MKLNPKKCSFGIEEGPFLGHLITKQGIRANPSKVKSITDIEQPKMLKDIQSLNEKLVALSRFLSKGANSSFPFFKVLKGYTDRKNIQLTQEEAATLQEMKKIVKTLPTLTVPIHGDVLMMYLATSTESINVVLFMKRGKGQVPIYFVSRVLQGAELNYHALEKLILALVHAARRLQRYFQEHMIAVLTNSSIKQALKKPKKSGRVAKWAIELGEHDIVFQTRDDNNKETPNGSILMEHQALTVQAHDIKETFQRFRSINMKLNPKKFSFGIEEGPFLGHLITKQGIRANPSKVKSITDIEQPKMLKDIQSLNEKLVALSRFLSKGANRSFPFFKVLKGYTDRKNIQLTQEEAATLQEMKKFVETLPTLTVPIHGDVLMMYLTTLTESINVVLFMKRGKGQLRTPFVFVEDVSLTFFKPSILSDSCVENTVLIPWVVWNLTALWIMKTTIPIFCIDMLPNSILYGKLDFTMTKLRVSLLVRGELPIVISKQTSPMSQDFSPENPTNRT
nr:protein NYNRIN-like [Tanacetum cinerariifolium]